MSAQQQIIEEYIEAYNRFDIEKMLQHFDEQVVFEHVADGITQVRLEGKTALKAQSRAATELFSERNQKIISLQQDQEQVTIAVAYSGTVAADLPDGTKKGTKLTLNGNSVFTFRDHKIIKLTDSV